MDPFDWHRDFDAAGLDAFLIKNPHVYFTDWKTHSLSLSHSSFLHFICDINRGAVADDAAAAATDNLRRDHFQPKKLVLLSTSHRLARFMSKAAAA